LHRFKTRRHIGDCGQIETNFRLFTFVKLCLNSISLLLWIMNLTMKAGLVRYRAAFKMQCIVIATSSSRCIFFDIPSGSKKWEHSAFCLF